MPNCASHEKFQCSWGTWAAFVFSIQKLRSAHQGYLPTLYSGSNFSAHTITAPCGWEWTVDWGGLRHVVNNSSKLAGHQSEQWDREGQQMGMTDSSWAANDMACIWSQYIPRYSRVLPSAASSSELSDYTGLDTQLWWFYLMAVLGRSSISRQIAFAMMISDSRS